MNINENKLTFSDIEENLNHISKKLYLKSPDVWIDFHSKIEDKIIDEMVLFYAAQYNITSILKYVIDNKILDLNGISKDKNYPSIKENLLSVAKHYKSFDFYNLLSENDNSINKTKEEKNNKNYSPVFICPHCNENLLNTGYKVFEEVSFAYLPQNNKSQEVSRIKNDKVFCCNCNNHLENISVNLLENLCSIHYCQKCGKNLTEIGINEKSKMIFNENNNKFTKQSKTYNCSNCDTELNKFQKEYFNL